MSRPLKDWVGPAEMDASRPLEDIERCTLGEGRRSVSDLPSLINSATFRSCLIIQASMPPESTFT